MGMDGMKVVGLVVGLVFLRIKFLMFLHLYPVAAFIFFFCFSKATQYTGLHITRRFNDLPSSVSYWFRLKYDST